MNAKLDAAPLVQLGTRTALEQLEHLAGRAGPISEFFCAAAYASRSGAVQLFGGLEQQNESWAAATKTFVLSLDYGRTEPRALSYLLGQQGTRVRVWDGREVIRRNLQPRRAFHPKLYLFKSATPSERTQATGLVGSSNLTLGGLTSNVEAVMSFQLSDSTLKAPSGIQWASDLREIIRGSEPVTESLVRRYTALWESESLAHGEEAAPGVGQRTRSNLGSADLRALWSAPRFWTETLRINPNRGPGQEGNQIDLKKGVRRFFRKTDALDRSPNSPLGVVSIQWKDTVTTERHLRYGNNGMDKITLPVPGAGGPRSYANTCLMFERIDPGCYRLRVGDGRKWIEASKREGTMWHYSARRRWGYLTQG